ncbi:MAG TPA: cytochrome c [Longimicrobiaceae bacterium]|nr:cytochrome c [Longimicrobiaceae bacterium]
MRHLLANLATYTIAALLVMGAALFAWVRAQQLILSDERTALSRFEPAPAHEFRWTALGRGSYERNCANCHGRSGQGWDQYPGLSHTARLFAAPGGREYAIDLHLYGLTSDRWRAPMPPMGHLPDVELAAVLNHVLTSFGNEPQLPVDARLYVPADVAARRGQTLTPWSVNERRPDTSN